MRGHDGYLSTAIQQIRYPVLGCRGERKGGREGGRERGREGEGGRKGGREGGFDQSTVDWELQWLYKAWYL